jgi:hypothetical protein
MAAKKTAAPQKTARRTTTTQGPAANTASPITGGSNATTAVKKRMSYDNPLAKMIPGLTGTQAAMYLGCSACKHDLDEYAKSEEMPQDHIKHCPNCNRRFVEQVEVKCYSCSAKMNSSGNCLNCKAKHSDDDGLKAATIKVRAINSGVDGKSARNKAKLEIMSDVEIFEEIKDDAKRQKWIDRVEAGESPRAVVDSAKPTSGGYGGSRGYESGGVQRTTF